MAMPDAPASAARNAEEISVPKGTLRLPATPALGSFGHGAQAGRNTGGSIPPDPSIGSRGDGLRLVRRAPLAERLRSAQTDRCAHGVRSGGDRTIPAGGAPGGGPAQPARGADPRLWAGRRRALHRDGAARG